MNDQVLRLPFGFSVVAALLVLNTAQAQPGLTLSDAVQQARAQGPWRDVPAARGALTRGEQSAATQFPNPTFEYRRENGGSPLPPDEFFTLTVPVDLTGRRLALWQARSVSVRRGVADSAAAQIELDHGAARAWIDAALSAELAAAAQTQAVALDSLAAFDESRFAAGAVAEVAALRTRVEADRAFLLAAAAQATAAKALATLRVWVGGDRASLASLAATPISTPPSRDALLALARRARPDALAAAAATEQLALRRSAERRGILGDVQLVGGTKNTSGFRNTAVVGFLLPLPLFNQNGGPRTTTDAEWRIAAATSAALALRVEADVDAAYEGWNAINARSTAARSLADRADDVAAIARATYREGASTLTAVLEAQRAAFDVRAAAADGLAALLRADLDLRAAAGRGPLDPWTP
jgi:outer membrane protein TolC